jgi:hypothetical protein
MPNPFTLPSDEEVFKLRDAERKLKSLDREKQFSLKVWQKTTSTAQLGRSAKVSDLLDDVGGDVDAVVMFFSSPLLNLFRELNCLIRVPRLSGRSLWPPQR